MSYVKGKNNSTVGGKLIVDNVYLLMYLKFIKLIFLPANTTAVFQPMDQGVIKNLNYQNQLVF